MRISAGNQSLCPKCGEWTAPGRSSGLCPQAPLLARRCWLQTQGRLQSGRSHAPGTPQAEMLCAVRRPQLWRKRRRRQASAEITAGERRMLTQRMWVPRRAASPCLPVSLLYDLSTTLVYWTLHFADLREPSLLACTGLQQGMGFSGGLARDSLTARQGQVVYVSPLTDDAVPQLRWPFRSLQGRL